VTTTGSIQLLAQAAEEVLGTMFFSFVDPVTSSEDLMEGPVLIQVLKGFLEFRGPVEGSVETFCTQGSCRSLAANFLGQEEDELNQEMIQDAFKEMTNMVVGRFLALMEPERVCELGLPKVDVQPSLDLSDLMARSEEVLVLDVGEGVAVFRLRLEK
jgi:CheY-specific phosphatase CheX